MSLEYYALPIVYTPVYFSDRCKMNSWIDFKRYYYIRQLHSKYRNLLMYVLVLHKTDYAKVFIHLFGGSRLAWQYNLGTTEIDPLKQ